MDKSFTRSLTASFAGLSCANKDRALPPMGSVDLLLRPHAGIGRGRRGLDEVGLSGCPNCAGPAAVWHCEA
jgi:hypothetical protein